MIHFAAQAGVGVLSAAACERAGIPLFPGLGPVAGFFPFDLAFYAGTAARNLDGGHIVA